ncbi:MAG: class I SAM-dependent methyltransferase [Candidatus Xenobiia bacterium LiM19]
MIAEMLARLKPQRVLDVGCGCGSYTKGLVSLCMEIIAVDCHPGLIRRCAGSISLPTLRFACMDGMALGFADRSFDAVVERDSLHHSEHWEGIVDEMLRVSSRLVLFEEPLDDMRTEEKKNTLRARELLLDLQREARYSHYPHIPLPTLTDHLRRRGFSFDITIRKSDALLDFDDFFDSFSHFAGRSERKEYWYKRRDALREDLGAGKLCDDDRALIIVTV